MLGDAIREALPRLRVQAESMMMDTCQVTRGTGVPVTDPDTGEVTVTANVVYEGPGKIAGDRAYERLEDVGEGSLGVQRYIWSAPWSAGPFDDGDVVEILASLMQPHLVGRRFRVAGRDERSLQTAQRMYVDIAT